MPKSKIIKFDHQAPKAPTIFTKKFTRRPLLLGKTAFAVLSRYPDIIFSKFSVQIYSILKNYIVYQIQIKTPASCTTKKRNAGMLLPE